MVCALMDMRAVTPAGNTEPKHNNRISLKSEVVIKGKDYGWIIQTGISTYPTKENNAYKGYLEFVYKLTKLKKEGDKWVTEGGVGWDYLQPSNISTEKFIVAPPLERDRWFYEKEVVEENGNRKMVPNPRATSDTTYFAPKVWSGIGEVVEDEKERDLLKSIEIRPNDVSGSELWATDGEFSLQSGTAGYYDAHYVYIKDKGWKYKDAGQSIQNILKEWYKPFKNKKIRWTNLNERCNAFSRMRNKPVTGNEKDLLNLCYRK